MSKTKKDQELMDKIEEVIKPLKKLLEEDPHAQSNKQGPVNISSGDEELDSNFKIALRKKKK